MWTAAVDFPHQMRCMEFIAKQHNWAEPKRLTASSYQDSRIEVRGAIGTWFARRAHCAGDDDGVICVQQQRECEGRLLERVRAMGHHRTGTASQILVEYRVSKVLDVMQRYACARLRKQLDLFEL